MDISSTSNSRSLEDIKGTKRRDEDKKKSQQHSQGPHPDSKPENNLSELRFKRLGIKV